MRPVLAMHTLDRYEALRAQVVAGAALQAEGWTMFVRQGLLAWGQACQTPASPGAIPRRPAPPGLPLLLQLAVVQVLASMVLQLHQEVGHGQ
jgi:hypothetical protein